MTEDKKTRSVLFEKYLFLDLIELKRIIRRPFAAQEALFAINNLTEIIKCKSEIIKHILYSDLLGNGDYELDEEGYSCICFDIYDYNRYCLYCEFAKYKKTHKNPLNPILENSIFADKYFGETNIQEFERFLKDEHEMFSLN